MRTTAGDSEVIEGTTVYLNSKPGPGGESQLTFKTTRKLSKTVVRNLAQKGKN